MTVVEVASNADIAVCAMKRLFAKDGFRESGCLYLQFGFQEVAPYRPDPVPGARFLELVLE